MIPAPVIPDVRPWEIVNAYWKELLNDEESADLLTVEYLESEVAL